VTVTTVVALDPATAFSIFTEEIGAWWQPKVRNLFSENRTGMMKFEAGPGGRLLEMYPGTQQEPFVVGRILTGLPASVWCSSGASRASRRMKSPKSRFASRP
jgi:hypothetical protein